MKIKKWHKKWIISGVVVFLLTGLAVVGCMHKGEPIVNAHEEEDFAEVGAAGDLSSQHDEEYEISGVLEGAAEGFAEKYDARNVYNVRNKNQNSEGMCWLYSSTTALEYALAKEYGGYYEVSTKHLDYLTIDGSYVYNQSGKTNVYFDRYLSKPGAFYRTDLGTSGANEEVVYGMANPLAIMSEADFVDVLKENDSRLAGINRFEDIWKMGSVADLLSRGILTNNFENEPSYMEKQDYEKVNDPTKVEYIVTGAKMASYAFSDARTSDSELIKRIKKIIMDYGAVKASVFGTSDRFENCSYQKTENNKKTYTFIIDGRVDEENGLNCKANHGMTIVGWDDGWEYEYNGTTYQGAFILQNSWGEDDESEKETPKWLLSYTSALTSLMYFDSVDKYSDYDYYYGPEEYKSQTIMPAEDELIFELDSEGTERIKALTLTTLYSAPDSYEIYVSEDGKAGNFKKDGSFEVKRGIIKYEFNNDYDVNGSYAVKIKLDSAMSENDIRRTSDTITVMTNAIAGKDEDDEKGDEEIVVPDVPKPNTNGDKTGLENTDIERDVSVPSTSASDDYGDSKTVDTKKPNTGSNTAAQDNGGVDLTWCIVPVSLSLVICLVYSRKSCKKHRRFD